jgi:GT2 family glycosyltransferase
VRVYKDGERIFLGYIHPGMVATEWMNSVLRILPSFPLQIFGAESGPLLSRARNLVLEQFLKTDCKYILMTDTDVVFEAKDVQELLRANKPIVGALYYGILGGNPNSTFPVALKYQKIKGEGRVLASIDSIPKSPFVEVDALGMGLTLVKRSVIQALEPSSKLNTPFAEMIWDGRHHGEDAVFCLRAKEKGYSSWLATKARVGHRKTITL